MIGLCVRVRYPDRIHRHPMPSEQQRRISRVAPAAYGRRPARPFAAAVYLWPEFPVDLLTLTFDHTRIIIRV